MTKRINSVPRTRSAMRSWRFLPAKTAANFDRAGGAGGRLGSVEGDTFSGMDV